MSIIFIGGINDGKVWDRDDKPPDFLNVPYIENTFASEWTFEGSTKIHRYHLRRLRHADKENITEHTYYMWDEFIDDHVIGHLFKSLVKAREYRDQVERRFGKI